LQRIIVSGSRIREKRRNWREIISPCGLKNKRRMQRVVNEELHNDTELSACRNIGEGSSRMGKRKITWQDQMELRV